ncbi:MAG TPA: bifunctional DNA-formamidopyrimidine glycosylase/DNA-(apurinic or apyrimidinic site) lyase [Candidatus Acidoferrales bacterium]
MPELPEVETVARGLRLALPGRRILSVRLEKTDFIDDPSALELNLPGTTVLQIRRLGKNLLVDLQAGANGAAKNLSLLIHLGMTGQIAIISPEAPVPKHTHVFLALDDGREFRYTDVRRFGRMAVLSDAEQESVLGGLGLEPLEISEKEFRARIQSRDSHIKALLLNQSVVRGMGNIYTDEALWRSKIHPRKLGTKLSDAEVRLLYRAMQTILNDAIRLKGSSISNYQGIAGEKGTFQQRHRVYGRDGEKCFRCKTTIRHATVAGRSTHFCPKCQPTPRTRARKSAPRQAKKLRRKRR